VLASAVVSIPREAYLRTTEGQPSLNKGVEMRWYFLHLPILFPSLSPNTMNQCTVSSVMTAILSALKKRHDIPKTVQALQDVSLYPPANYMYEYKVCVPDTVTCNTGFTVTAGTLS
jgi:hypothetical protein